jgi:hypothetical protein
MSAAMAPADRERLARLLGMIGSAHDGEALNAARLADRLIRDRDVCPMPDDADCLFHPRVLPERAGVLEEIISPPWAHGLDIKSATGSGWYLLMQHAGGDPTRLRQIQEARGYKPGWVRYAVREAAEKRAAYRGAA